MNKDYIIWLIAFAVNFLTGLALGYTVGRSTVKTVGTVEYIVGKPVRDTVLIPMPVKEEIPVKPILPVKPDTVYFTINDTIYIYVRDKIDTAAIIAEYIVKRFYDIPLFDNNNGKADISLWMQYNRLGGMSYTFTPITQIRTDIVKRVFVPFASVSYSTIRNTGGIGGGVFYHDIGIEYLYQRAFTDNVPGHQLSMKWKF